MDYQLVSILAVCIFGAAVLYASVGHGGASGYLAVMALFKLAPEVMRPTALALNVLVAGLATITFRRAGCISWRLFWPFAVTSVPLAFVGGALSVPGIYYKPIVGAVLLFAAIRLLLDPRSPVARKVKTLPIATALIAGAGIGLLSGLTGVGGGIFLSPLLLFAGWAEIRETSGTSAAFVLVNSVAALIGHQAGLLRDPASVSRIPIEATWWGIAALAGGWIGAEVGSRRLNTGWIRRLLGVVLVIAGLKLMLT